MILTKACPAFKAAFYRPLAAKKFFFYNEVASENLKRKHNEEVITID